MLDPSDGVDVVRTARRAAARAVDPAAPDPAPRSPNPIFAAPRGVFVTLNRWPAGDLRGCIGFPLPVYPLGVALDRAAASAALEDPRFPPVRASELRSLTVEVSVLTLPEPLPGPAPEVRRGAVRIGVDGLILERGGSGGLLLPQVAPEQGWDALELLEGTCRKAGLPRDAWKDPRTTVRRFQAEVFSETSPDGPIVRRGEAGDGRTA